MVKMIIGLLLLAAVADFAYGSLQCSSTVRDESYLPKEWMDMKKSCVQRTRDQIKLEFTAAYQYLAMGAYFSRDTVNRPGFADMFFKAAKEEREHGSKLIDYLSMRGELTKRIDDLIDVKGIEQHKWESASAALKHALELEIKVTKSIRELIKECENANNYNDYHLVDYLTGVYLEEQLNGQRELAGKLSTLEKMMNKHGALGEFLFDKNL